MNKQRNDDKRELSPNELLHRFERSKVVKQLTERLVVNGLYSSDAKDPKNRRVVDITQLAKAGEDVDHEVLGKELRHVFNNNDRIRRLARVGIVYFRHSDKIVTPGAFIHLKPAGATVHTTLGLMTRIKETGEDGFTHAFLMEQFSKIPKTQTVISFIVNNNLYHLEYPGDRKLIRLTNLQSISSTRFAHEELVDELKNTFGDTYYRECLEAVGITYCSETGWLTTPGWHIDCEEHLLGKTTSEKQAEQTSDDESSEPTVMDLLSNKGGYIQRRWGTRRVFAPNRDAQSSLDDSTPASIEHTDTCAQFIRDMMLKKWKIKYGSANVYTQCYPLDGPHHDLVLSDLLEQFSTFPNYAHTLLDYDIVIGYGGRADGGAYRLIATLMCPEGNVQAEFTASTVSAYDLDAL